jgi:tRNA (cytosine38-C5)-methyltransferase
MQHIRFSFPNVNPKGYGKTWRGSGPLLLLNAENYIDDQTTEFDDTKPRELPNDINKEDLRLFTPREIANLLCFPSYFSFPASTTIKQQYRLLGNSINVLVVSEVLKYLLMEPNKEPE